MAPLLLLLLLLPSLVFSKSMHSHFVDAYLLIVACYYQTHASLGAVSLKNCGHMRNISLKKGTIIVFVFVLQNFY